MLEKRYNFKESEAKAQKLWKENAIYRFEYESSKDIYSIDTPPPTVSGSLHIGHIFSYTQAEMIARFQRMQGKNVFYPFGFDDNGLPTERLVEREEHVHAHNLKRSEFIDKCMNTTKKYVTTFKALWQSMGFSVDWNLQYETISPSSIKISQKSFLRLAQSGNAYLKETPVLWCSECQTSIAQAELEFAERKSSFNYITFLTDDTRLTVATTRPELLFGCVALLIHPDDSRFNMHIGKNAVVPLYNFSIPILGDEKVSMDKGTGIVMCATFGDTVDLEWYKKYNFTYKKVINPDGTINADVPYIGNKKISEARQLIIEKLGTEGLLLKSQEIVHDVAVHERCGKDVEIIPSKQWFINIMNEKERFLKAADEINWYPNYMKDKYKIWVQNLKWDWCISRQRYFGVPFPVWYCKKCGAIHYANEKDLPVNPLETLPKDICSCGSNDFIPETAVLDTWATSSLSPMINSKWSEENDISDKLLPMSMRTQAHEIIRTWAFYTIVKSIYHTGKIPWKDIMLCGFVMAKKGEKISKSKGNASLSPEELIIEHSADVIRYWAANSKLGTDTMFNKDELQISQRFITKLWNASKFAIMHLEDYEKVEPKLIMPIDKWIMESSNKTMEKASHLLEQYEVGSARHEIDDFFWNDFCDNYLEIVKDRLYKPEIHGIENRISAQYALYNTLLSIIKMYAIYVPHIVEEIYQNYFIRFEKTISIHKTIWGHKTSLNNELIEFGTFIMNILMEVRKYKAERNLSLKAELEKIEVFCPGKLIPMLNDTFKDLQTCTGAKVIEICNDNKFLVNIK